jgi:hypothetical protein
VVAAIVSVAGKIEKDRHGNRVDRADAWHVS